LKKIQSSEEHSPSHLEEGSLEKEVFEQSTKYSSPKSQDQESHIQDYVYRNPKPKEPVRIFEVSSPLQV